MPRRWRAVLQRLKLHSELVKRRESVVLAGEADVGDAVHVAELQGDTAPDLRALHLPLELPVNVLFDHAGEALLGLLGDRALSAGGLKTSQDALTFERHPRAVALDHHQARCTLDAFVGGEPLAAGEALAPSAHRRPAVGGTAVDHTIAVG
jgi:hypothetical protein